MRPPAGPLFFGAASLYVGEIIKPSGRSSYLNGACYLQQWRDMRGQKFREEVHNIPVPAE